MLDENIWTPVVPDEHLFFVFFLGSLIMLARTQTRARTLRVGQFDRTEKQAFKQLFPDNGYLDSCFYNFSGESHSEIFWKQFDHDAPLNKCFRNVLAYVQLRRESFQVKKTVNVL